MSDYGIGRSHQLHGAAEADIACTLALADHQLSDIHGEILRNLIRQTIDFDRPGDDFEQSALHLHSLGVAGSMYRNGDLDALGEIDPFQIGMQQVAPDGVHLLIEHHDRGEFAILHSQIEDGVIACLAFDDAGNLAGVHADADGVFKCTVHHRRNLSGFARTARFVLTARGTHLGVYGNILSHYILLPGIEVRFTLTG